MEYEGENQLVVKKFCEAVSNNDLITLRTLIHPNYRVASRTRRTLDPYLDPHFNEEISNETDLLIERLTTWYNALSEYKISIVNMSAEGRKVWVDVDFSGIHTGTLFGIHPTNNKIKFRGLMIYEIENGLLINADWLHDYIDLLKQLGRSILIKENSEAVSQYMSLLEKMGLISIPS